MTHRPGLKLRLWLVANKCTYARFSILLDEAGVKVSPHSVKGWTEGHMPRRASLIAIERVTGGEVTAASFL